MARMIGSWLSGPSAAIPKGQTTPQDYKGQRLGLPRSGPGSLATTTRRVAAIFTDWIGCMLIVMLFLGDDPFQDARLSTFTLALWFVVGVVCVTLFSVTPGQALWGMQVARIDGPHRVGLGRALFRQALITFAVPAVITDADGRGMHDQATGTALVRTR